MHLLYVGCPGTYCTHLVEAGGGGGWWGLVVVVVVVLGVVLLSTLNPAD